MVNNICFVGGIHGTGKSTLCNELKNLLDVPHYSCSAIIKEKKNIDSDKSKIAKNIPENQDALSYTLNEELDHNQIVLDGHFALFSGDYLPTAIPDDVFQKINIKAIVVMICEPYIIRKRILERDGKAHPVNKLTALQELELKRAEEISRLLQVPYFRIDSTSAHADEISQTISETIHGLLAA